MKGIVLAGGFGTRLRPLTLSVSKQLLPVYNKPLIYYPISTLMGLKIRDILIISAPGDDVRFRALFGDGSELGVSFTYAVQPYPGGLAEAFLVGERFIAGESSCLILGDNLFYSKTLDGFGSVGSDLFGAHIFGIEVDEPKSFGVVTFDDEMRAVHIEEKPDNPQSSYAIPGLYLYDPAAVDYVKALERSERGELEITALNLEYLRRGQLEVTVLEDEALWFDCGSFEDLLRAGNWVKQKEIADRTLFGSPEVTAMRNGWITADDLSRIAVGHPNQYGQALTTEARSTTR